MSPLSHVFSPTKNKATNRFANVPGAVENGSALASDDISFTASEAKVMNWDNTEVSTFGSKTASDPDTPSSTPPDDSHSTEFSTITTLASYNGQLGAQPRVEDGSFRHPNDSGARARVGAATQHLPRSIPNVEMANPPHGPSSFGISKWVNDDEDSDIVSNPTSSVEEESARRPRMTQTVQNAPGEVAVSIFIV